MHDERRITVVEEDTNTSSGVAGVCGTIFFVVMALALLDRGLTVAWSTVAAWFN